MPWQHSSTSTPTPHPVLSGVAEVHGVLDRMHAGAAQPLVAGEHALVVAELDRATRRIEASS